MQVGSRKTLDKHENGWLKAAILVIAWLIIVSLIRDVWQIRVGFDRIAEAETRFEAESAMNTELKRKMGLVITESYKEKLIREKLNMQKEGEVLVVMPKRGNPSPEVGESVEFVETNPQKWWNLIK